jgi:hypothetical protein
MPQLVDVPRGSTRSNTFKTSQPGAGSTHNDIKAEKVHAARCRVVREIAVFASFIETVP